MTSLVLRRCFLRKGNGAQLDCRSCGEDDINGTSSSNEEMSGSSRDGPFGLSVEDTLRDRIAELYATISAKDVALQKASAEIAELKQQLAQSRLSNPTAEVGSTGFSSHSHASAQSISSLPFALTTAEWTLFDNVVKTLDCRDIHGKIQWPFVAQEFAKAADNKTIYARDKDRLQSSYRNLSMEKKAELNADIKAKLAANIQQSASVPMESQAAASSSSSVSISHTTTTITNNTISTSQSAKPVQKSKSELPFSFDERAKIKEWGNAKKTMFPPQDVTEHYLFNQHLNHYYSTLQYTRKGSELKEVWNNYWKDNKHKHK